MSTSTQQQAAQQQSKAQFCPARLLHKLNMDCELLGQNLLIPCTGLTLLIIVFSLTFERSLWGFRSKPQEIL